MSDLPPTSSGRSNFEEAPDDLLKQGLTALKQQDYAHAVQCLSKLSHDRSASGAVRLKAHIGLAKALRGDGQTTAAIALVKKLTNHPQPKVQQWAQQSLRQWTPASPATPAPPARPPEANLSGFRPLGADLPASRPPAPDATDEVPKQGDRSGFQPIDLDSEPSTPTAPDTTSPAATDNFPPDLSQPPTVPSHTDASSSAMPEAAADGTADPISASDATGRSLFHYEQLNQLSPTPADATPSPHAGTPSATEAAAAIADSNAPTAELLQFQHAGRLPRLRALPKSGNDQLQLWGILGLTAIAFFWLSRTLTQWLLAQTANFLEIFENWLPFNVNWQYREHTVLTFLLLLGVLLAAPWLLDWLFRQTAQLQPLSMQTLQKTHPEGCRLLRRIAQKRGWLMPLLRELPTDAPIILSYGWLPRYTRIVVSRGLLEQLEDEELATLIGYELTHVTRRTLPYLSLVALILQGLHQGYWQVAQWGDRRSDRPLKVVAAMGSTLCYTLFWLVRKIHVPLSRSRVTGSDRQTVEWTGNPNGLTRALIKLEHGIAQAIAQAGYTPPLVESTDLFTPCGYEGALSPGSLFPDMSFLDSLYWDIQNPYRRWLSLNSSHPRLGERLKRLTGYAIRWQLSPEIPFPSATVLDRRKATFWDNWLPFLQQVSPYIGPVMGIVVAMLLWFLGGIFEPLGLRRVAWVYGDRSVLWGSLLLGLGMGIMIRINPYFPDITSINRQPNPPLPSLLSDPMALPTDSVPVRLAGTLLGRRGMANWLCQDFILKTPAGLLKLHFLSVLGAFGNLLIHPQHPSEWAGRMIEVEGWYRRGAIAWLDADRFLKSGKAVAKANHPIWSVVLSLLFCGLGLLILLRG